MAQQNGQEAGNRGPVVLEEGGTCYVARRPGPTASASCVVGLGPIDWLELARQKQALLRLLWGDGGHPLWGLVQLLDALQDEAERRGHNVVFATEGATSLTGEAQQRPGGLLEVPR